MVLASKTIRQLYIIYDKRQVEGVPANSWFLYAVLTLPLLVYSIKRKDFPMIMMNGLFVCIDLSVFAGVLLYR